MVFEVAVKAAAFILTDLMALSATRFGSAWFNLIRLDSTRPRTGGVSNGNSGQGWEASGAVRVLRRGDFSCCLKSELFLLLWGAKKAK